MNNLNCIKKSCKYKDGFYCVESCGSYVIEGATLKDIGPRVRSKNLLIYDESTKEAILQGPTTTILGLVSGCSDCKVTGFEYSLSCDDWCLIGIKVKETTKELILKAG